MSRKLTEKNRGIVCCQKGLTLLEVLIALSIFALIGVASFRILSSVIDTQQLGDIHSQKLAQFQKALMIIDTDLQQVVNRPIRIAIDQDSESLLINNGQYPLELTRAGRANPLKLSRSSMQRVAYDIGFHPEVNNSDSEHYRSRRNYLRRQYWPSLDRSAAQNPLIQVLLTDTDKLKVALITNKGKHQQWPPKKKPSADEYPVAIEFAFNYPSLGVLTRLYKVD